MRTSRAPRAAFPFTKGSERLNSCCHCGQWLPRRGRFVGRQMIAFLNRLRLAAGALVTYAEMTEYLWGDDPEGGPLDPPAIFAQYTFHLRRSGYPVLNVQGVGHRFAPMFAELVVEPEGIAA